MNTPSSWGSYPKIQNVGHPHLSAFFTKDVRVEEKVDGSQFSFGMFNGELRLRSKNRDFTVDTADNMFRNAALAVENIRGRLVDGWTYRGEYLNKPKHNALAYDRVPKNHIVIFDIATGYQKYADRETVCTAADVLGFESVPVLHTGRVNNPEELHALLETESFLGGQKIEGLVFKRTYGNETYSPKDGKPLIAKYVSERFKEIHRKSWKQMHPTKKDIVGQIVDQYAVPQRFEKCVQHLRDNGELTSTVKDIGALMRQLHTDIEEECKELIKEDLWNHYRKNVLRLAGRALPNWYKEKLTDGQFCGG